MQAITVSPGQKDSARLERRPDPVRSEGQLLVRAVALGVCGTDREILQGEYGWAPPGHDRLVLGHESLGVVEEAPDGGGFAPGDWVVGIVRRPDPVPCPACARGEWDMCRNGRYTERGIKALDGYGAERFVLETDYAVKVDAGLGLSAVLLEPASVLAKAWDHIERIGARSRSWAPRRLLVTGAGPVGLLGAMMGAQRGLEVHVYDQVESGPKPGLVSDLGGTYHRASAGLPDDLAPDIIIECTGASSVVIDMLERTGPDGVVCLTGVSSGGRRVAFDAGGFNRVMVLENDVVFGSVNANRAHYQAAAEALAKADRGWLSRLITRRVPLEDWRSAFQRHEDDVKVIIQFDPTAA
jgi:threonine dehydrogenase-like Zn-dependent dehydrogenase